MAVTKQVYTAAANWTASDLANLYRSAFIDAGLMTDWFDSASNSWFQIRVMKFTYDNVATYGTCYYIFVFATDWSGFAISSGWNTSTKTQTGTQFLDYHVPIASLSNVGNFVHGTRFELNTSPTTSIFLYRYTSGADTKQSWFVTQQGTNRSRPFTLLHPSATIYSWLDLNKGIIDPYSEVVTSVSVNAGFVTFREQENVRRSLLKGHGLNGVTATSGNQVFHGIAMSNRTYTGLGSVSNAQSNNWSSVFGQSTASVLLPVGRSSSNPAYTSDYIPICSGVPWSAYTSNVLASDFGVYMHYADNTIYFQDRFVVTAGVEEWEVLNVSNNSTILTGASPTFLARVV